MRKTEQKQAEKSNQEAERAKTRRDMGVKYWTDLERLERGESGFGGLILIHRILHPAPKERRERKSEREKLTEKLRKQAANDRTIVVK